MMDFGDSRQDFWSEPSSNDNPNNRLQKVPSSHRLPRAQWFKASLFSPDSLALPFGRNCLEGFLFLTILTTIGQAGNERGHRA
jgi:hypothetical protein